MCPFDEREEFQTPPENRQNTEQGSGAGATGNTEQSIDLNRPIENPALVEAIKRHAQHNTAETSNELFARLNEATYLIIFYDDEVTATPGEHEGETVFEPGSVLKLPTCTDANDQTFLPLFTDWNEIDAWIDEPVSTLVMHAKEAWEFVLHDQYDGAVINPAGQLLPLEPQHLQALLDNSA